LASFYRGKMAVASFFARISLLLLLLLLLRGVGDIIAALDNDITELEESAL
jgi:hypothetical protein